MLYCLVVSDYAYNEDSHMQTFEIVYSTTFGFSCHIVIVCL
jgi:hypothetical protein